MARSLRYNKARENVDRPSSTLRPEPAPILSTTTRRRTSRNQHPEMLESTRQTEEEVELKDLVREEGRPVEHEKSDDAEVGGHRSREKTAVVDFGKGKGPEEIIIIDWAEGDPEASRTMSFARCVCRPDADHLTEPVQLPPLSQSHHPPDRMRDNAAHVAQLYLDSGDRQLGSRMVRRIEGTVLRHTDRHIAGPCRCPHAAGPGQ